MFAWLSTPQGWSYFFAFLFVFLATQARSGFSTLDRNPPRSFSANLSTGIHVPPFVNTHFDGDGALAVTALNDQPSGFAIVQIFREHWVRRQVRRGG
jgi:hypothetical protein